MSEFIPASSVYVFTDPPRYYKANDPYYWELDNVPLQQIQENVLWLKDQLGNAAIQGVKRKDFDELRPYVDETDRTVKVLPGRFSARINDAYNLTPFQHFLRVQGTELGDFDRFRIYGLNDTTTDLSATMETFKTITSLNAMGMNGLIERAFTAPVLTVDFAATNFLTDLPTTSTDIVGTSKPIFPISEVLLWSKGKNENDTFYTAERWDERPDFGFVEISRLENEFVKRWRGISRIAIVDVAEELEISVPTFNEEDFFYYDENGDKQLLDADVRIDLVFIYSKSIDTSSTTIGKYENGVPRTITKPELGIVLGAGLGINFERVETALRLNHVPQPGISDEGISKILANPSDELNTDLGFSGLNIHGSFPSPDDLMNLAPLLSNELESTSLSLIGQSVLPVAYIVSRRNQAILVTADLVDIRPFFRTAELAYNERAGIAAAMPQLSIANPAVGKAQLDVEILKTNSDLRKLINAVATAEPTPRPVAAGYIFGGFNFGVESTYKDFLRKTLGGSVTSAELEAEVKRRLGIGTGIAVPSYPDWDIAKWAEQMNVTEKGLHPNDYINIVARGWNSIIDYGSHKDSSLSAVINQFGVDNLNSQKNYVNLHFCKKTISIDRSQVPWMSDYIVNVNFLNCFPLSTRATGYSQDEAAAGVGLWVEKNFDSFTIYAAWVANDAGFVTNTGTEKKILAGQDQQNAYPYNNRDEYYFSTFAVITQDIMNSTPATAKFTGESGVGVATYPSVTFEIIGIPASYGSYITSLNGTNPIITLS